MLPAVDPVVLPDVPAVLPDPLVVPEAVLPDPLVVPEAVLPEPPVVVPEAPLAAPLPMRAFVRMNPPAAPEAEPLALVPLPVVPAPVLPDPVVALPVVDPDPDVPVLPLMLPAPVALARHPTTVTVFPVCDELVALPDEVCAARPAALAIATAPMLANSRVMVLSPCSLPCAMRERCCPSLLQVVRHPCEGRPVTSRRPRRVAKQARIRSTLWNIAVRLIVRGTGCPGGEHGRDGTALELPPLAGRRTRKFRATRCPCMRHAHSGGGGHLPC
jgi:hypothetical protein